MFCLCPAQGRSFHISPEGADDAAGTKAAPLRTIQAAAELAQPGDEVVVHAGVYRERIDPPRGGLGDDRRVTYRSAPGERVVIKGSEVVSGWKRLQGDTWSADVPNTLFADFNPFADLIRGDWFRPWGRKHHTGAVYLNGHWLTEAAKQDEVLEPAGKSALWFAEVGEDITTIWAQFKGVDPNRHLVEVNVRQAVFYPSKPGMNYITVKGFVLEQAATPWAPPTAEQIGLIGTHWSKGWRIEDNTIRYATCVGVTLGKYGDEWDNRAGTAEGYNGTIRRALERGWSKQNIGSHWVSGNHISHCEQAGIVGSLGAVFSTIRGNHLHDIHVRKLFGGAEMAAIKFHAPIDMLIEGNCIHGNNRGIWLDWMAQGVRVTRNLLFDNGDGFDLFMEVNHGPYLVDHNLFLSDRFLWDMSTGGAFAHNLAVGDIQVQPQERRTPYHEPHSTALAGLSDVPGGDNRWFNNLLAGKCSLDVYRKFSGTMVIGGNVDLGFVPQLVRKDDGFFLVWDGGLPAVDGLRPVTSERMGSTRISKLPYEQPDASPYLLDEGYFRKQHKEVLPGPFAAPPKRGSLRVWPR